MIDLDFRCRTPTGSETSHPGVEAGFGSLRNPAAGP